MASILKNQILKHLSKFTKNLSPDKINLSTLKGEGELSNLELDEAILMDLLDLPTWMKLTKAVCNKVSIKIQWTKLKSQPICLFLDEVFLEIETCSEPRPPNNPAHMSSYRSGGKYGFVDKVIDGIYVHINSVTVQFNSQKFLANLQLSRVVVQSLTPNWNQFTDLRQSRIRNEIDGEILLFKEIDWQTTRIEANVRENDENLPATPLRLIANQSKVRIILKKKLSDCSIISSRIILLLDDILWVLTDTQLKAAILYANSLRDMIEKSTQQSKKLAADKLQKQRQNQSYHDQIYQNQQQQQQHKQSRSMTSEMKYFQRYDVATTSYHFITGRIDLHLCDDTPADKELSPKHNRQIDGGAMQITFCKLSIDFYPFHEAGGERKQWYRYVDNQGSRNAWVQKLFQAFRKEASRARKTCQVASPTSSPAQPPSQQASPGKGPPRPPPPATRGQGQSPIHGQGQGQVSRKPKLLESCMVLRIEEFIIYRISTADNKRSAPKKFFCSDKKALHLPSDMSMVHIEYTDYFFTEGLEYPVPHANLYVLVNPVRLTLDYLTILWANYFSLNLAQYLETQVIDTEKVEHVDVKIEALMPRVVLSAEERVENQPDRPDSIQLQISKLTASNTHVEEKFLLSDLKEILRQYPGCDLIHSADFPNERNQLSALPKNFVDFAESHMNPYLNKYAYYLVRGQLPDGYTEMDNGNDGALKILQTNTLKRDQRCDIWTVCMDQLWLEFLDVPSNRTRPVPFVESVPLTLWTCQTPLVSNSVVSTSSSDSEVFSSPSKTAQSNVNSSQKEKRPSKIRLKEFYSTSSEDSIDMDSKSCDSDASRQNKESLGADNCDNSSEGNVQYVSGQVANFNVVAKVGGKVRAQMNHFQYLFLMRVLESFSNFQAQMNADLDQFLKGEAMPSATFSIPLMIPDIEFAMVCPYIAELLPLTHPADLNSPVSDVSEQQDGYQDTDSDLVQESEGLVYDREGRGFYRDENSLVCGSDDQMITVTQTANGPSIQISESLPIESHLSKSQSDSRIVCHTQSHDDSRGGRGDSNDEEGIRRDSHSTDDVSAEDTSPHVLSQNSHFIAASDSGLSSMTSMASGEGQRSRSSSKLTSQAMKKSITTGVNNLSNFMGKIKNKLDPDDLSDDSDRLSIKTDLSDDDFEFLVLDETEMPVFNHGMRSDTASTLDDTDDLSSVFADSTTASKAKELVSAIVFRLSGLELLLQGTGPDIFAKLHTQKIDIEETGNIVYEDFYSKLSSSRGIIKEPAELLGKCYPLKFKFVMGPAAETEAPGGSELGFMDARIKQYKFEFNMSSIMHMTSFIEDEKVTTPTPMHVKVSDLTVVLKVTYEHKQMSGADKRCCDWREKEDRPPANPSQPTPVPTVMNIHELFIHRYDDGVFHMTSAVKTEPSLSAQIPVTMAPSPLALPSPEEIVVNPNLSSQEQLEALTAKNKQLHKLLEQIDNHSQVQGSQLNELIAELEEMKTEKEKWKTEKEKLKSENEKLGKANEALEADSQLMSQRVVEIEEDLKNTRIERDSFDTMLKCLNDELIASEERHRKQAGSNQGS